MNSNAFDSDREEEEKDILLEANDVVEPTKTLLKKQKTNGPKNQNLEVSEFDVIRSKSGSDFANSPLFMNSSVAQQTSPDGRQYNRTEFIEFSRPADIQIK